MAKINGKALTDKGQVKSAVRENIAKRECVAMDTNTQKGFEQIEKKSVFVKKYTSENGNVYAVWTLTVSTNDPSIEKPKKAKEQKAPSKIDFVEEE